ncbi:MAG TPA: hypothetical protein VFR01_08555 [Geobacterales bacterium]|nr:hypothetical protein [Geobacterales bacterium]
MNARRCVDVVLQRDVGRQKVVVLQGIVLLQRGVVFVVAVLLQRGVPPQGSAIRQRDVLRLRDVVQGVVELQKGVGALQNLENHGVHLRPVVQEVGGPLLPREGVLRVEAQLRGMDQQVGVVRRLEVA